MPKQIPELLELPAVTNILQNAPIGILIIDNDERIIWANETFEKFFNIESENLIGKLTDMISVPALKSVLKNHDEIVMTKTGRNDTRWLRCWHQALKTNNSTACNICFLIDVSDQYQLQQEFERVQKELEAKSTRDPLTGLFNRRGLMQILETQVSRSRRYDNPLSIIRLQIGDYRFNDGKEPARNQVLLAVGHLFSDQLRWADVAGRLDNNDFLLILPETDNAAAEVLVSKIEEALHELMVGKNEQHVSLNVHFGITSWIRGDDQGKLLERAEQSMNASKTSEAFLVTG